MACATPVMRHRPASGHETDEDAGATLSLTKRPPESSSMRQVAWMLLALPMLLMLLAMVHVLHFSRAPAVQAAPFIAAPDTVMSSDLSGMAMHGNKSTQWIAAIGSLADWGKRNIRVSVLVALVEKKPERTSHLDDFVAAFLQQEFCS